MITDKMNPLLRKLAKEPFQLSVDHAAELDVNYMELFTVLFAEAIVQECVSIMDITDVADFRDIELALKIKQHFGVE